MEKGHDWRIRPAVAADVAAIQNIAEAAYAMYLERMDRKPFPMLDDYAAHIAAGRTHVLEDASGVAGYIVMIVDGQGEIWLDTLGVMPDRQGRGYGRALVEYAEEQASASGFARIRLYTNEAMRENLSLYPHLGYAETHRAEQKGYKRVFFVKDLPGRSQPVSRQAHY